MGAKLIDANNRVIKTCESLILKAKAVLGVRNPNAQQETHVSTGD